MSDNGTSKILFVVWASAFHLAASRQTVTGTAAGSAWLQARAERAQRASLSIVDSEWFEEPHLEPDAGARTDAPSRAEGVGSLSLGAEPPRARAEPAPERPPATASKAQSLVAVMRTAGGLAPVPHAAPANDDSSGSGHAPESHQMQLLAHDKAEAGSSQYLSVRLRDAGAAAQHLFGLVSEGVRAAAQNAEPSWWSNAVAQTGTPANHAEVHNASAPSGRTSRSDPAVDSPRTALAGSSPSAMKFVASYPRVGKNGPPTKAPNVPSAMLAMNVSLATPASAPKPTPRGPATFEELERKRVQEEGRERERQEELRIREEQERQQRLEEMMTSVRADRW